MDGYQNYAANSVSAGYVTNKQRPVEYPNSQPIKMGKSIQHKPYIYESHEGNPVMSHQQLPPYSSQVEGGACATNTFHNNPHGYQPQYQQQAAPSQYPAASSPQSSSEGAGYGEGQVEGAYQWNNQQYESYPSNYDNPNPGLWMGTGGYYAPNYQNNGLGMGSPPDLFSPSNSMDNTALSSTRSCD
ncbi:hypothetical protein EB796_014622 [Bugula neritina]|uniref:Uncharacterized protein n=1 Tax=Bugula neritina TaxID=10212 RepID=A0A7J7JN62_BUGNE|nr:hypothetical protein EB796_014622 [Bugula neritina]